MIQNIAEPFINIEKLLDVQTVEDEIHNREFQKIRLRMAAIIHECQSVMLHVNELEHKGKMLMDAAEDRRKRHSFPVLKNGDGT